MYHLVGFVPGIQGWLNIQNKTKQIINVNYRITRFEGEKL